MQDMTNVPYAEGIGSIMYVMGCTRPDITPLSWFEISVHTHTQRYIQVLEFFGYIRNIGKIFVHFDKNISETKNIQNSWKNSKKNDKIRKNIHVKVIL